MYQVQKRDGKVVEFSLVKISDAIKKAFEALEKEYNQDIIDFLALKVTADFTKKIENGVVAVETSRAVSLHPRVQRISAVSTPVAERIL